MLRKEIIVGTYEHGTSHPKYGGWYSHHSFGGTNSWAKLVERYGLENIELEVILRPKTTEKSCGGAA